MIAILLIRNSLPRFLLILRVVAGWWWGGGGEGGVALAAIQGLNQTLNDKDAEIQELKIRLEKLEHMMEARK